MQSCTVSKYLDRICKIRDSKAPVFSQCLQTKPTQEDLTLSHYALGAEMTSGQAFGDR